MKGVCHLWSRGRHISPSLPGDRYLKLGSQKRPTGRNLGGHRLVRRSGTTSRGTAFFVFSLRMLSFCRFPYHMRWKKGPRSFKEIQVVSKVRFLNVCMKTCVVCLLFRRCSNYDYCLNITQSSKWRTERENEVSCPSLAILNTSLHTQNPRVSETAYVILIHSLS